MKTGIYLLVFISWYDVRWEEKIVGLWPNVNPYLTEWIWSKWQSVQYFLVE